MDPSRITIVVLNWNKKEDTLSCLQSLAQADLGGASILVVDNGSKDHSLAAIRERFPDVQTLALAENRGYAGGNNAGIRVALEGRAEGVLLLNNDTRVAPDFLRALLWTFDIHPEAGAVSSAIHRMDRPEMLDVAHSEVRFGQRDAVQIRGVNALPGDGFGERREVEVAVGCSLLLSARALRKVGLLDEDYFAYHEDVDWCLRARKMGFRIFYEPFSRVFHRGSASTTSMEDRPEEQESLHPGLPNAEPLPWNPISTYLGARNLVRLLRTHATAAERRSFLLSCVYEIPLELGAIVVGRVGWMRLGRFSYGDFARFFFLERHPSLQRLPTVIRLPCRAVLFPADLLWALPRAIVRARRNGRTRQWTEQLRGFRDGVLNAPLPLDRLGLR
jgi:GT2 family glycosyltransferase